MATSLILTLAATRGTEVVGITTQTINFVTPQAAEKALKKIKEEIERDMGAAVFINGVIVGDVIL